MGNADETAVYFDMPSNTTAEAKCETLRTMKNRVLQAPEVKEVQNMNTDLVGIPSGTTNQLQVLDVVVNKPFKDHLQQQYNDWLPHFPTAKKIFFLHLANWISATWRRITPESNICWQDVSDSDGNSSSGGTGSSITISDDQ
ncbi:hypothetical protein PR048_028801 [Dryococelus australis]|uniref:DDE-1 domain-containing protein n=1 Tax=Dryococelus australis TaxID=614101 RepID=A0ABQ9GC04_9NEOP|nr:hypothetical protein PR048_028801 [Dryococelus australis]